ncbi:MAG: Ig-like domain-containing protein, partial [Candidatus Methanomethylophilaceae archaeon]|nr:Ig-like domain-containing protein [Candidatus Methanomethylophilaceae archaeon]
SLTLTAGDSATLTATVAPSDATNKNVAWSSSNTDVVTVVDGKVTAVSVGTANVAVTTEDGAFSEVCKVIVIPAPVPVTGVTLDKSSLTLTAGDSATLTATVAPSDATNKNVAWSSSDAKVAIVVDGKVTAVSAGTATITVTTEDGEFSATCAVTVVSPVKVTGVSLDKTKVTINVGDTVKLTATVTPSDAANKKVSWSTSDSKIVTVSDGTVKGVSKGTATVTVTTDDGGYTATCTVTVEEPSSSGDNTLLYIGIAAAVIIAILVAIYFLRMRK